MGGRGKACHTCNQQQVSCQVDREPMVSQGESKVRPKDDGSLKRKKCKVSSKEIINDSEIEAKDARMAEPEATRVGTEVRAGPMRVTSRSKLTQVFWVITADL